MWHTKEVDEIRRNLSTNLNLGLTRGRSKKEIRGKWVK